MIDSAWRNVFPETHANNVFNYWIQYLLITADNNDQRLCEISQSFKNGDLYV
jgi:hypothetical protein